MTQWRGGAKAQRKERLKNLLVFSLRLRVFAPLRHVFYSSNCFDRGLLPAFEPAVRDRALALIHETLKGVCTIHGGSYEFVVEAGSNPPVDNDARLAAAVRPLLASLGKVVDHGPIMGAEDFAHYQQKIPGFFLFLGTGNPAKGSVTGNHTPTMNLDEDALPIGVAALVTMAWAHADLRS